MTRRTAKNMFCDMLRQLTSEKQEGIQWSQVRKTSLARDTSLLERDANYERFVAGISVSKITQCLLPG